MSPGGGGDRFLVLRLLLPLVIPVQPSQVVQPRGGVGCLFSGLVCGENEVCFNDLVIGRCVSASSTPQDLKRLGPLEGPPLGLLEAELSRVFGLGFSWPDLYTQCVFQTLLHDIEKRLPYSRHQCTHLLTAQRLMTPEEEEEEDEEGEEEVDPDGEEMGQDEEEYHPDADEDDMIDNNVEENDQPIFIPEENLRYYGGYPVEKIENDYTEGIEDGNEEEVDDAEYLPIDLDDLTPEEEEEALLELQQVLGLGQQLPPASGFVPWDLYSERQIPEETYFLMPSGDHELPEEVDYAAPYFPSEELSLRNIQDEGVPLQLEPAYLSSLPQLSSLPKLSSFPQLPAFRNNHRNQQSAHPVEKREAPSEHQPPHQTRNSPASSYSFLLPQGVYPEDDLLLFPPPDADFHVPDLYAAPSKIYPADQAILDNNEHFIDKDDFVNESEEPYWNPDEDELVARRTNAKERHVNGLDLDQIYDDTEEKEDDVSNYDFDYPDSMPDPDDGSEDDIFYYSSETDPEPMESVFDRKERLDVKKPGPFFTNSHNNFFIDKLVPTDSKEDDKDNKDGGQTEFEYPLSPQGKKTKKDLQESIVSYTEPSNHRNNYLHIQIKDRFNSLGQANKLADYVADHLQVKRGVFTEFRPEQSRLLLKVNSNPAGLNATTMADLLSKDQSLVHHVKQDLGLDIDNFAAGDKDSVVSVYSGPSNRLFLLLFLLTAGLASLLLLAGVLLILRRRSRLNTKVSETKTEKEEPVKEYKQLVRDWSRSSRASGGSNSESKDDRRESGGAARAAAPPTTTSGSPSAKPLKRSSQNSEGSRTSSTSSWQEDPGVTTMDISTGHMVLSYMEDHLKNKQRLEQEWVGLCAYEAEPNSTSIAFKVENKKKNRYPDKLPYDHNRVLLNALVNGSNSDYINASTVMDHDPRNPAYIITQGPLAHTVADFWQMVWEQGSVVIVMLCRLNENGYQLAQRYWPEEGSDQYHIFEVHLVSEHVWCDDYLVRSLYLKNSQTGETRTVTQFHFLSWPDSSIPTSTRAILEFRRKVNKSYRGRSCPMIVHCSDGVGRSGTYVLIDMVLNRMTKGSKEIDIAATLEHIRDQRSGMVQTRSQFEFCLMAVAEETHAILKALPQ